MSNSLSSQESRIVDIFNPAQVTSKHKHRCCPCPKWPDFVYSLILD